MLAPMPRGARRLTGAVRLAGVVLGALVTTSCGGVGQPASYDATGIDGLQVPTPSPDPADFVAEVDNPWFPLPTGTVRSYVVDEDGREVGRVRVEVLGVTPVAGLDATVVRTSARVAGEPSDPVVRLYAQDEAGNVWLVGEDRPGASGWRAGEGGAEAGLVMPAEPRVGDGWVTAQVPGAVEETVLVEAPVAEVPDGVAGETVWTTEEGVARTRNVYAAGLGLVQTVDLATGRTTTLVDLLD